MIATINVEMAVDFELTPDGVNISGVSLGGVDVYEHFEGADLTHLAEALLVSAIEQDVALDDAVSHKPTDALDKGQTL